MTSHKWLALQTAHSLFLGLGKWLSWCCGLQSIADLLECIWSPSPEAIIQKGVEILFPVFLDLPIGLSKYSSKEGKMLVHQTETNSANYLVFVIHIVHSAIGIQFTLPVFRQGRFPLFKNLPICEAISCGSICRLIIEESLPTLLHYWSLLRLPMLIVAHMFRSWSLPCRCSDDK